MFGEQGLSDEILFASCVPDAMRQARRVVLECAPRLEKLFARSFPGVEVVARTPQSSSDAAVDYVIPSGSLPRHFRRTLSDFPRRPYLVADERAAAAWAERLAALSSAPKIGIAWRGSGETPGQAIELAALTRALPPEAELISLQPGDTATEIAGASHAARPIHRWIDLAPGDDLDALAALLSRLDLVISIPNVMAHVAGALGRPTWTLIPWAPSWQWFAGIDRSPWYAEMRLWRQTARNDWGGALRALGEEARRWLQSRPRTIEAEPSPASMRSAAIPGPHFVNPNFRESAHDPGRKPLRAP